MKKQITITFKKSGKDKFWLIEDSSYGRAPTTSIYYPTLIKKDKVKFCHYLSKKQYYWVELVKCPRPNYVKEEVSGHIARRLLSEPKHPFEIRDGWKIKDFR